MSRPQKRGKLRNPPRGRQYAYVAIIAVILVAGGSGAYLYVKSLPPTPVSSSSSSSSLGSASSRATSTAAYSGGPFPNPPCTAATQTSSASGKNGTYALICTNLGLIEVQLSSSPTTAKTVSNFANLAKSGFYNDVVWHRIVPGFVIQAGDPNTKNGAGDKSTWGQGTSGQSVPFEYDPNQSNTAGTIAMASTGAGVGGSSQFYINLVDNSASLDGKYAVFGTVINGMNVVQALGTVPTNAQQQPASPAAAYIVSITIQNTP